MATYDVREDSNEEITEIVFGSQELHLPGCIATHLSKSDDYVYIENRMGEYLWVKDKVHANNLIKALNKAIELGWIK